MQLNSLQPAPGSKKQAKRVGRGIGSTDGKTCGFGHKGQRSRGRGKVKPGFEGGQMPLHRRLPKHGFSSYKATITAQVRVSELAAVDADIIDIQALKDANVINNNIKFVKVFLNGEINKAVTVKGIRVSKGAQKAIEAAGGKVE